MASWCIGMERQSENQRASLVDKEILEVGLSVVAHIVEAMNHHSGERDAGDPDDVPAPADDDAAAPTTDNPAPAADDSVAPATDNPAPSTDGGGAAPDGECVDVFGYPGEAADDEALAAVAQQLRAEAVRDGAALAAKLERVALLAWLAEVAARRRLAAGPRVSS
jgi:hypothetical protein